MKIRMFMAAVSAVALMTAASAHADTAKSEMNVNSRTETASPGREDGAPMTKAEVQKEWNETKADVKEAVAEFKATVLNEDVKVRQEPVRIETRATAEGIIGQAVYNKANEKIATVKDIILDKSGNARLIVLKDGDFMGLGGKLAAFDYDMVIEQTKEGDIIMPITEKSLEKVAEFSYDMDDAGESKTRVIPKDGYSVNKLLDGDLIGTDGKKLAAIDNISFRGGKAHLVFATHSQLLKMGGDKVAVNFDATRLTQDKDHDNVNLKLSAAQTRQFESFKKSASK